MAICPHCKKELEQNKLEHVMNNLGQGVLKDSTLINCEHCDIGIDIIYERFFYYIKSINKNEEDQIIGAK